ncbi:MAG: hypothetical protein MUE41_14870 [Gemmatimonadaceae bacterium]|nr:hypothetical protein [Gemmatimonadaceae bacterium]
MRHLEAERLAALHESPPTDVERAHLLACAACRAERDAFAALARLALDEGTVGRRDIVRLGDVPAPLLTSWHTLRPRLIAEGLLGPDVAAAEPASARGGTPWWWRAAAAAITDSTFTSAADAQAAMVRAQALYESAAGWLAVNDTAPHSSDVYRTRLAALDDMVAASREALRSAPQDPVLNQYFLSASSAREATIRQLGGVLPAMQSIDSY